ARFHGHIDGGDLSDQDRNLVHAVGGESVHLDHQFVFSGGQVRDLVIALLRGYGGGDGPRRLIGGGDFRLGNRGTGWIDDDSRDGALLHLGKADGIQSQK